MSTTRGATGVGKAPMDGSWTLERISSDIITAVLQGRDIIDYSAEDDWSRDEAETTYDDPL